MLVGKTEPLYSIIDVTWPRSMYQPYGEIIKPRCLSRYLSPPCAVTGTAYPRTDWHIQGRAVGMTIGLEQRVGRRIDPFFPTERSGRPFSVFCQAKFHKKIVRNSP
jgi:hypothetical protein